MRLVLALIALFGAASHASAQTDTLTVRLWQFEPDGSRFALGRRLLAVPNDAELRLMIGEPGSRAMARDLRLDATLAMYDTPESTVVAGTVAAGRVTGGDRYALPGESRSTIEEHRYRLDTRVKRGEPVWFFPFGQPKHGERGIAIELARGNVGTDLDRRFQAPGPVLLLMHELGIVTRSAPPVRIRIETGQPAAFTVAYEGPVHPLAPITFRVPHSTRAAPLAVVLDPRPWFGDSNQLWWRWYWTDGRPSGGWYMGRERTQYLTLIHGSGGQLLRLTVLPSPPSP